MKEIKVDELVIGAGLTGLMYGNTSVDSSYRVAITEAHYKSGGYATNFQRNKRKYTFDCSQHKVTGIGEGGNLRDALVRANLWDKLDFIHFDELAEIHVGGKAHRLPPDGKSIQAYLEQEFPHQLRGLKQLFNDINTHGYQNYMFARMLLGEYTIDRYLLPESRKLQKITTKEYFRSLFSDKNLVELLGAIAIYLGAIANEANAMYFLHYLYAAFETNPAYVKGTGQVISNALEEGFKEKGGTTHFNNPATSIEVENGQIVAVNSKKYRYITNKVVATCSPKLIIDQLPKETVPDSYRKQLNSLQVGWGHICVYTVLDVAPESLGITSSEYLIVSEFGDDLTEEDWNSHLRYEKMTLSVTNSHLLDPKGGKILKFIILDHKGSWFDLEEDDYLEEKENVQQIIIRRVLKTFPQLEGHFEYMESSTPRTNFKYTSSPEGSAFGYKVLPKENMRFLNYPPVKGLKFIGGWSTGPGYETGMCLGFTHALLNKKNRDNLILN